MTSKKFAYIRVSSKEQNLDRQIEVMKDYGISETDIFSDKASGKDFNRLQYRHVKNFYKNTSVAQFLPFCFNSCIVTS